jgi:hypothetical protein
MSEEPLSSGNEEEEDIEEGEDDFATFFSDVCAGARAAGWQPKFDPSQPVNWTRFYDALYDVTEKFFVLE